YKTDGLKFPMKIDDIHKFERMNDLSIYVYSYDVDTKKIFTFRAPKLYDDESKIIDLLYTENEDGSNSHYSLINNLSRLLSKQISDHDGKIYICRKCNNSFSNETRYKIHIENCNPDNPTTRNYVKKNIIFENFKKTQFLPFMITADFESVFSDDISDEIIKNSKESISNE